MHPDGFSKIELHQSFDNETETLAYLADSGIARRVLPRLDKNADNVGIGAASRLM